MRLTQRKGDTATACAIAAFTCKGWDVSIPLTESAPYDLVVDTPFGLKRVQVKYSSSRAVDLRHVHSNSRGYVIKKHAADAFDWLVIYFLGEVWLCKECPCSSTITVKEPRFEKLNTPG